MVRINIIEPRKLLDQHLLAEWNEIQMLLGTMVKHPEIRNQPSSYKLGKGHINFFKDKALYLFDRLHLIYAESKKRGYDFILPEEVISMYEDDIDMSIQTNWTHKEGDFDIIKSRLLNKHYQKMDWYTYYGRNLSHEEYINILCD